MCPESQWIPARFIACAQTFAAHGKDVFLGRTILGDELYDKLVVGSRVQFRLLIQPGPPKAETVTERQLLLEQAGAENMLLFLLLR